ncbi:MAG: hypothetical protein RIS64_115 [Bacteroidota bacterium]|jgi:hypothetical protein
MHKVMQTQISTGNALCIYFFGENTDEATFFENRTDIKIIVSKRFSSILNRKNVRQ